MENPRSGINADELKQVYDVRPDLLSWMPVQMQQRLFDGDLSNGELVNIGVSQDNVIKYQIQVSSRDLPNGQTAEEYKGEFFFYGYKQITPSQADAFDACHDWGWDNGYVTQ
jgi:hypothetical protein